MASPQKEYGYTSIANEIMDALVSVNMSGHEFRLALFIMRKTYGYNKCEDAIALSQMMKAAGLSKVRCSQIINRLELRKIVTVTEKCNGLTKKYKFNKDFEQWVTVTEKCNGYRKVKQGVTEKRNAPLQKSVTTKDNITKDNIQITADADFDSFYKAYPLKRDKKDALVRWGKLKKNNELPPLDELLRAIERQNTWREAAKKRGEFVPEWKHPATWLNKGSWLDEVETPKVASSHSRPQVKVLSSVKCPTCGEPVLSVNLMGDRCPNCWR